MQIISTPCSGRPGTCSSINSAILAALPKPVRPTDSITREAGSYMKLGSLALKPPPPAYSPTPTALLVYPAHLLLPLCRLSIAPYSKVFLHLPAVRPARSFHSLVMRRRATNEIVTRLLVRPRFQWDRFAGRTGWSIQRSGVHEPSARAYRSSAWPVPAPAFLERLAPVPLLHIALSAG